jgi:ADP-heptose:LPS heptosyltransferase
MTDRLTRELGGAPHRIAVVRALQLGDVLVATPALRALRAAFPAARITFVGLPWARSFVQRSSHLLDDFLEFPGFPGLPERDFDRDGFVPFIQQARERRFDAVIQLHGSGLVLNRIVKEFAGRRMAGFFPAGQSNPDPALFVEYPRTGHEISRNLTLLAFLGIPPQGEQLEFPLAAEDFEECSVLRNRYRLDNFVCVHAGARYLTRRWPADRFAAVADELFRQGYQVALTGSPNEAALVADVSRRMSQPHVNLAGQTSLGALAAILKCSRLLITNDTGVSHVASAVGVRSVVIVMGSDPDRWAPLDRKRHAVVYEPVDCRPCGHYDCPIGHPCATRVTVESVLAAACRQLKPTSTHWRTTIEERNSALAI